MSLFAILFVPDQGLLLLIELVGLLAIGAKKNYMSPTVCVHRFQLVIRFFFSPSITSNFFTSVLGLEAFD